MHKHYFIFALFLAFAPATVAQTIKNEPLPITRLDLSGPDEDLAALAPILQGKKIVAMGEASHAAREMFQAKARFFKYLAEQHGFRVFAIESTLGSTYPLNRYLLYGEGDKLRALAYLDNFFWNTEEVMDLVDWIRLWNQTHANPSDKILFLGFDVNSPGKAAKSIADFFQKSDPDYYKTNQKGMVDNLLKRGDFYEGALAHLQANQDTYRSNSANWEYLIAWRAFENIRQGKMAGAYTYRVRDKNMADNVDWLLNHFGQKIFLWAHNFHIAAAPYGKTKCMGAYLRERHSANYFAIGFDFYEGMVWAKKGKNAIGVMLHGNKIRACKTRPPKPKPTYLTWLLSRFDLPTFFIETKALATQTGTNRLRIHDCDEWYPGANEYPKIAFQDTFDALIFCKKVSPTRHFKFSNK